MPTIIIVGAQWGDEGKGKVVDLLTKKARHVVRSQGGHNLGHTVHVKDKELPLRLIPSSILYPHTQCYIAAGTVIDPKVLLGEIESLEELGIGVKERLWISHAAHVIFPYHRLYDQLGEERKGDLRIGTTGRGIGPCYADKINRIGIRMGDLIRPHVLSSALKNVLKIKNEELQKIYNSPQLDVNEVIQEYEAYGEKLKPYVKFIENELERAMKKRENIILEAAQGTLLDVSFGSYPYVTSTHTTAGGICSGVGIGPTHIDHTLGVVKAYTTRIGNGPFPTELSEEEMAALQLEAPEFGNNTALRKRRWGWFDVILVKESTRLNGIDSMAVTKLDILDTLDEIKICVGYEIDGKKIDFIPHVLEDYEKLKPIYEVFPGWKTSLKGVARFEDLPPNAQHYLLCVESLCGVPISLISVGPERECTVMMRDLFDR